MKRGKSRFKQMKSQIGLFADDKFPDAIHVFTDGSCLKNPGGKCGWAAILKIPGAEEIEMFGCMASGTNNIAEMTGPIRALEYFSDRKTVIIYSDSQYVVKGASEWIHGWKRRGWVTAEKNPQPIKNIELWKQIDALCQRHQVFWKWVRGHNGHVENERCDHLAGIAAVEQVAS